MQVWRALTEVRRADRGCAVTIGVFDGVHLGHQAIVRRTVEQAVVRGATPTVVTFDPHPMRVVRPEHAPLLITELEHRIELLGAAGADAVLVLPFDRRRAAQSAEDFVQEVLVDALGARGVVVGDGFRFGHRAAGTVDTLVRLGSHLGFDVHPVGPSGDEVGRWSSTYVRQRVAAGDVDGAADVLGRPFRLDGPVVSGDRRGRTLGYPTANIRVAADRLVPADGVYAGWLLLDGSDAPQPAAVSIGSNPTFDGDERRVEAYVLDRDDLDLYGQYVRLDLVTRLRGMQRFADVDTLLAAMADDVSRTRDALSG